MKIVSIVVVMVASILAWTRPASAHQLDEYLQATTLDVQRDHVRVKLRLTPGVAVSNRVLAEIDANHDGSLSDAEKQAYSEHVRRDLKLSIDERESALHSVSTTYSSVAAMREGTGEIVMTFDANVASPPGLERQLAFVNHHRLDVSTYLVNAILVGDSPAHIFDQVRSEDQSTYHLTYAQPDWPSLKVGVLSVRGWLIAIALAAGALMMVRRARPLSSREDVFGA